LTEARSPTKILAEKSVYSPWLICKTTSGWKFGWTIWYRNYFLGIKIFALSTVSVIFRGQILYRYY